MSADGSAPWDAPVDWWPAVTRTTTSAAETECHHVIEEAHAIFCRTQQEAAYRAHQRAITAAFYGLGARWSQAHAAPTSRAYTGADAWIA